MIGRAARPSAAGHLLWVAAAPGGRYAPLWRALGEHQRFTVARLNDVALLRLLALIRSRPRAIVLDAWDSPALLILRWWGRRCGIPLIASCGAEAGSDSGRSLPSRMLRHWFFRGADLVLTCDARSTAAMVAYGVPRARVVESFDLADVEQFIAGRPVTHAR